jgi:hypothetical protein
MESAVRRVRANTGAAGDAPTPPDPYRPPPRPVGGAGAGGLASRWTPGRSDRWLVGAVAVAAVAVVALAVALILSLSGGGSHVAAPPASNAVAAGGTAHHPARSHTPVRPTSTSTTLASTPGGPPVIDALSPSSGAAGQSITITGANFLSSDGHIVAAFNGQVASTSCPSSTTCTATVPPSSVTGPAQVTVTTAAGTSNTAPFTYS